MGGRPYYNPQGVLCLTRQQRRVLMLLARCPTPTLADVGRSMGLSKRAVLQHVAALFLKGYLEYTPHLSRRRRYRPNERGRQWCRRRQRRQQRQRRRRRLALLDERNRWLYHHRMRGVPYWDLLVTLQRTITKRRTQWTMLYSEQSVRDNVIRYAKKHNLPLKRAKGSPMVAIANPTKIDFQPSKDYLLLKRIEPGETAAGLALPDGAELGPPKFKVLAAGPGRWHDVVHGQRIPMDAKVGDVVYIHSHTSPMVEVVFGDQQLFLARDRDVVGKG